MTRDAHEPLLIIGGEGDHIVPWSLNQKNYSGLLPWLSLFSRARSSV
jgi:hypothetical protein